MDSIKATPPAAPPAPATPPAPAAPAAPAAPQDKVEVGQEPSLGFKLLRGTAGFVAGTASGIVHAGLGAVRHAGDRHTELPPAAHSTLRIAGAGLGLIKGVALGLAAGPIGVAVGIIAGPILGAWSGGALAGGVEAAVDAGKGSFEGLTEGYQKGSNWARGLVDSMAAHEQAAMPPAGASPAQAPAQPQPDPPKPSGDQSA